MIPPAQVPPAQVPPAQVPPAQVGFSGFRNRRAYTSSTVTMLSLVHAPCLMPASTAHRPARPTGQHGPPASTALRPARPTGQHGPPASTAHRPARPNLNARSDPTVGSVYAIQESIQPIPIQESIQPTAMHDPIQKTRLQYAGQIPWRGGSDTTNQPPRIWQTFMWAKSLHAAQKKNRVY